MNKVNINDMLGVTNGISTYCSSEIKQPTNHLPLSKPRKNKLRFWKCSSASSQNNQFSKKSKEDDLDCKPIISKQIGKQTDFKKSECNKNKRKSSLIQ